MRTISRLFKFYINASIHVALAVVSLYLFTVLELNLVVNLNLVGLLFCATIVCYNFVKYGVEAEKYLIVAKPAHKPIQIFSFLAFGANLYFLLHLKPVLWGLIAVFSLFSALYAIPFLPNSKNLRSLGGLKIFLIALIWTGFTVILPLVDGNLIIDSEIIFLSLRRFLLVLILILPFEVRDMQLDTLELQTLPQRFGVNRTKYIGYLLIVFWIILALSSWTAGERHRVFVVIVGLLLTVTIYRTEKVQSPFFASFWVEAIPMVLLGLSYGLERLG